MFPNPETNRMHELWAEALESGTYIQARRALRDGLGHCCLGVACDIINPHGWGTRNNIASYWAHMSVVGSGVEIPHRDAAFYFELTPDDMTRFTVWNDRDRASFVEIALEVRLRGYTILPRAIGALSRERTAVEWIGRVQWEATLYGNEAAEVQDLAAVEHRFCIPVPTPPRADWIPSAPAWPL
jgi:hypothetical protein